MSLFPIVIIFAVELRLIIVSNIKVYKSRIVTVRGFISLFIIITSERLIRLSLLSGVSDYKFINRLLAFTLYLSLIKSVIDTHYKLDIFGELAKAIYSSDLILNVFLKTLVELGDIGVVILI